MKLGLKIRTLRHRAGLDQQQAAGKLQISIADYSRIETGLLKADDTLFEAMLALFSIEKEQFNGWPDDKSQDWLNRYLA